MNRWTGGGWQHCSTLVVSDACDVLTALEDELCSSAAVTHLGAHAVLLSRASDTLGIRSSALRQPGGCICAFLRYRTAAIVSRAASLPARAPARTALNMAWVCRDTLHAFDASVKPSSYNTVLSAPEPRPLRDVRQRQPHALQIQLVARRPEPLHGPVRALEAGHLPLIGLCLPF